jgi:hypothetical protein
MKKIDFDFKGSGYSFEYDRYQSERNVLLRKQAENVVEFGWRYFIVINLIASFLCLMAAKTETHWYYIVLNASMAFSGYLLTVTADPYRESFVKIRNEIRGLDIEFKKKFDEWFKQKTAVA